ncbi:hypothetical protein BKA69DRAFT_1064127 [Paraphysoderma sedebokerense]|nr:hypothetical protein BKA69DRAFT_1064127 [Paraphysoderma sedebokerense]
MKQTSISNFTTKQTTTKSITQIAKPTAPRTPTRAVTQPKPISSYVSADSPSSSTSSPRFNINEKESKEKIFKLLQASITDSDADLSWVNPASLSPLSKSRQAQETQSSVNQLQSKTEELENKLAEATRDVEVLRANLTTLLNEKEQLVAELKENDEIIRDCKAGLESAMKQEEELEEVKAELRRKNHYIDDMESKLVTLEVKIMQMEDEKDLINELRNALEETMNENEQYYNKVAEYEVRIQELESTQTQSAVTCTDSSTQADYSSMDTCSVEAQTDDKFDQIIAEAEAAIRDFKMMKCANATMYQEMLRNSNVYQRDIKLANNRISELEKELEEGTKQWKALLESTLASVQQRMHSGLEQAVKKLHQAEAKYNKEKKKNEVLTSVIYENSPFNASASDNGTGTANRKLWEELQRAERRYSTGPGY